MPKEKGRNDEDLDFVLDTFQNAMSPFSTPSEESHARRKILRGIARRRAPQKISLLDHIEHIVKDTENGRMTLMQALKKLETISAKHGDKNLHKGVKMKIAMINGDKPKERIEKPVALFSLNEKKKTPTIMDFVNKTSKQPKKKPRKRSNKKRGKKKSWDPLKDEHPLSKLFGGK